MRAVGGVLLGYISMAMLVFFTFSLTYLAMGPDGAFQPGTYEVSPAWIAVSFALSLLAAIVGGMVCRWVSHSWPVTLVFAAIVLVLGLLMAIPVLMQGTPDQGPREGNVSNLEAMTKATQPVWIALLNPVVGAAGIILGGRLRGDSRPVPPAPPAA